MAKRRRTYFTTPQLVKEIADQKDWIAEHGGDLAGYIRNYGDPDPNSMTPLAHCFGAGGTAIYQADNDRLESLEKRLAERKRTRLT